MAPAVQTYRPRRATGLALVLIGQAIGFAGYLLTSLNQSNALPPDWGLVAAAWFGLGLVAGIVVAWVTPYADPTMLGLVFALTGVGLAQIHRIDLARDTHGATTQLIALVIAVVLALVVVAVLRQPSRLKAFPYLLSALGLGLLLLPLLPGIGSDVNGSRIWISLAGYSFQPAELAKIVLAASFAAYLTDKREVLSLAGRKLLGLDLPRMRDLGPIAIMWGVSLAIMVFQNDFGTSLLFFGLFVAMIYLATGKVSWVVLGLVLFAAGGAVVVKYAAHVGRRVDFWLHPFDFPDTATQIIQAQFGLSHGGLLGSGWGLGRPTLNILPASDMIPASLGEEIGLVGLVAVIVLYALLAFRGLKTALVARDPFLQLFAAGLSFGFILQVFLIVGGVTRLLPLTGLTTPFMSQGGSSMVANWLLAALLIVISQQARRPAPAVGPTSADGVTDLDDEATQLISVKQLARVGLGETHPVERLDAVQVRVPAEPAIALATIGHSGDAAVPDQPAEATIALTDDPLADDDVPDFIDPGGDGR